MNYELRDYYHYLLRVSSPVATGFPAGQTPLKARLIEINDAVLNGATEIDVVINRAYVLAGNWKGSPSTPKLLLVINRAYVLAGNWKGSPSTPKLLLVINRAYVLAGNWKGSPSTPKLLLVINRAYVLAGNWKGSPSTPKLLLVINRAYVLAGNWYSMAVPCSYSGLSLMLNLLGSNVEVVSFSWAPCMHRSLSTTC